MMIVTLINFHETGEVFTNVSTSQICTYWKSLCYYNFQNSMYQDNTVKILQAANFVEYKQIEMFYDNIM